jgi:hypothetical protein
VSGRERDLWGQLDALGDEPWPSERSDADVLAGALAQLAQGPAEDDAVASEPVAPQERPRRVWWVALVAGVGLAAAAAFVLFVLRPGFRADRGEDDGPGMQAPHQVEDTGDIRDADERELGSPASRGERGAEALPVDIEPVDTSTTSVESTTEATVGEATGEATGEDTGATPRSRVSSIPKTADGLLSRAQAQLRDGKTKAALQTYARLVDGFPSSREAKAALVSMGRIELGRGRAAAALAHFDAYLAASAGALVEEARYGRIRALRKLGRRSQELGSIEAFLADHPGSIYATRLEQRAAELTAGP